MPGRFIAPSATVLIGQTRKLWFGDDTLWRRATEAEALLLLGRTDEARQRYRDLIARGEPEPWQRDSMHLQAIHLAHLLGRESLQNEVDGWFR